MAKQFVPSNYSKIFGVSEANKPYSIFGRHWESEAFPLHRTASFGGMMHKRRWNGKTLHERKQKKDKRRCYGHSAQTYTFHVCDEWPLANGCR
jgi:hypothetical protein